MIEREIATKSPIFARIVATIETPRQCASLLVVDVSR
jgi:hypothetical protein